MNVRRISILLGIAITVAGLAAAPAWASRAELASASIEKGLALLANGDFTGAKKAFAIAARTDTDNAEYRQRYALLRRVMKMRKAIKAEKNPEKWESTAQALRTFYHDHDVYSEALPLDREFHTRQNTAESAAMLADTQLALDLNTEAAQTLAQLDDGKTSTHTQALLGIALAREGKLDEAKTIAANVTVPDKPTPVLLLDSARLHSLIGESERAAELLVQSFELMLPSRLDGLKAYAKGCSDFSAIAAGPAFGKALQTESKVKESGCSGGSSCGSCPSRGSCGTKSSKSSCKDKH